MLGILIVMSLTPDMRVAVMMIPGWILCLMVAYQFKRRKLKAEQSLTAVEADI